MIMTMMIVIATGDGDHGSSGLVEHHLARVALVAVVEVEHVVERAGDGVERTAVLNPLAGQPVVLDEAKHRGLVGQRVIDVVAFRKRRHHQQRHPRSVAAASPCRLAGVTLERRGRDRLVLLESVAGVAETGTVERIHHRAERGIHDRRHLMIVPAVGVIIENDDGSFRPFRALLQGIDDANHEMLLVERVRISGMPVLERRGLQETHGRQVARLERGEEVIDVIIVIGRIRRVGMRDQAVTDGLNRTRTGVGQIAGRCIILEPCMVRDVVHRRECRRARHRRIGVPQATGRTVGVDDRQIEAAHERTPGDVLFIEEITDVLPRHRDLIERGIGADIPQRIAIADLSHVVEGLQRITERFVGWEFQRRGIAGIDEDVLGGSEAVGLARDQVDGAGRRGAELRGVVIVVQREMLGVIPQGGDGVAVIIAHHQRLAADAGRRRTRGSDEGRETIHPPIVIGAFLRAFVVPLIRGQRLGRRQAERVRRPGAVDLAVVGRCRIGGVAVGIVVEEIQARERREMMVHVERGGEAVDLRRARRRHELRLAGQVEGVRIGAEIVVERDVFLEDDDDMLDRRRGG